MTRPNFLYITVDSIRADHTGYLGYDRPTSPTIDRLADRGTACEKTIANGIPTFYAFKTLLGGVPGLGHSKDIGMPDETTTLAEAFRDDGYTTAGFNAGNPWLTREYGYDRGFDEYRDFLTDDDNQDTGLSQALTKVTRRAQPYFESSEFLKDKMGFAARTMFVYMDNAPLETAETVTAAASQWLENQSGDEPFFLWVHYMDPHYPWIPRAVDRERFGDSGISKTEIGRLWHKVASHSETDLPQSDIDRIHDLYDAEIRRTDDAIDRLLDVLDSEDQLDETVVSVVGDHGTELHDHGSFSHGPRTLYNEIIHVPLVFAGPSVPDSEISGLTSHLDIPVSLLDLAGIEWDPADFAGTPVFNSERETVETEVVYDYEPRSGANDTNGLLRSCIEWPWKLISNEELSTTELYNLERDPGEQTELSDSNPAIVTRLTEQLDQHRSQTQQRNNTIQEKAEVRETVTGLKEAGRI